MPSPAPKRAPAALLLACVTMLMAAQASAAATWKVELVPTPITRDTYEATTTIPATCFKISQTGKCGSSRCCCDAPPPTTLTIKNVAPACARTNKPPAWTVDDVPQDGPKSARFFGKGAAKLSGGNSPSLTLTLPAWAAGQTERIVCINTGSGACGTFAKICNNRASCPVLVGGTGVCGKTSKCTSAPTNIKTAPLATATHAIVLAFKDAAKPCVEARPDHFDNVANAFEKDMRGHLAAALGNKAAPVIDFTPQFCAAETATQPSGAKVAAVKPLVHGIFGFVSVTGAPGVIDDALKVMDDDTLSHPTAVQTMCQAGGGSSCGFYGVATGVDAGTYDGNTYVTSAGIDALKANIGTGFNILNYNPPGDFIDSEASNIATGNWLTSGRVYDYDSIAAQCGDDACFDNTPICTNTISVSTSASSGERQHAIAASASITGKYAGITGSASGSFNEAQSTFQSSNSLAAITAADCVIRTFKLPTDAAQFSDAFVANVGSALKAIADAKKPGADAGAARAQILGGLTAIYNNHGTHVPTALAYAGFMRLELLIKVDSLATNYTSSGKLEGAVSSMVSDFAAQASTNSEETNNLLQAKTGFSFLHVPAMPRVPLTAVGEGYKIDSKNWTDMLLEQAPLGRLYPKIIATTPLADLFSEAAGKGGNTALKFGNLTDEQTNQFATLSTVFQAFVTNDVKLWETTGLPMPQLLDVPNYLLNGQCVKSKYIVRVNEVTPYGSSFSCVTCVKDIDTLPSDPRASKFNYPYTDYCTVGDDQSIASVSGVCLACDSCKKPTDIAPHGVNEACLSRGSGYTGMFLKPATCEGCVDCVVDRDCGDRNGFGGWYGGNAERYEAASCVNNICRQCASDDNCRKSTCINWNCAYH